MNALKELAIARQQQQAAKEPTRLTAASLAHLLEVRTAIMHGRRFALDAADIVREAREERAVR